MWCSKFNLIKLLNLWKARMLPSLIYRPLRFVRVDNNLKKINDLEIRRIDMKSALTRFFVSVVIAIFVAGVPFTTLSEAKVITKEKKKSKLTKAVEPELDKMSNTVLNYKIKEKGRMNKMDGSIEDTKNISGLVSWIRDDVVAVEYYHLDGESKVMLVPLSDTTSLRRLQSLQDLNVGDEIKIEFSENFEEEADGKKRKFKREAKSLDLIRSADEMGDSLDSGKK